MQERKEISACRVRDLLWSSRRPLLLGMGTRSIEGFTFNLFSVYLLAYVATNLELPRSWALDAILVGACSVSCLVPLPGGSRDRVGRKPVYRVGRLDRAAFAFPAAFLSSREPLGDLAPSSSAWASSTATVYGPLAAFWSELLRHPLPLHGAQHALPGLRHRRVGLTPLIAAWLVTRGDGTLWWVATYVAVGPCSLTCAHLLRRPAAEGSTSRGWSRDRRTAVRDVLRVTKAWETARRGSPHRRVRAVGTRAPHGRPRVLHGRHRPRDAPPVCCPDRSSSPALLAISVLLSAPMLSRPASTLRIVAMLVGGQTLLHLVLSLTAGHAG